MRTRPAPAEAFGVLPKAGISAVSARGEFLGEHMADSLRFDFLTRSVRATLEFIIRLNECHAFHRSIPRGVRFQSCGLESGFEIFLLLCPFSPRMSPGRAFAVFFSQ